MTDKAYRTVAGFIYTDVWDRDAGGRKVRDFYLSYPVTGDEAEVIPDQPVRVTVWDTHADVEIHKGDYVVCNGSYEIFKKTKEDGDVEYQHSISANKFINQGNGLGKRSPVGSQKPAEKVKRSPGKIEF